MDDVIVDRIRKMVRHLSSSSELDVNGQETDKTYQYTFLILFYALFVSMLVVFKFVFARSLKSNREIC